MIELLIALLLSIAGLEPADRPGAQHQTQPTPTTQPAYQHTVRWPEVERWHQTALNAGWQEWQWPTLGCIIWHESNGNPRAFADDSDDESYGLAQVNMKAHRSWVGPLVDWDFTRLFDPHTNLTIARRIYNDRDSFTPWTTYRKCR